MTSALSAPLWFSDDAAWSAEAHVESEPVVAPADVLAIEAIVRKLNAAMRNGEYDAEIWRRATGKTLEELGNEWKESLREERADG